MTIQDKIEEIKEERSLALNSIKGLNEATAKINEKDSFSNSFLFSENETHYAIQELILLYYKEKELEDGSSWSSPSLTDYTKNHWEDILEKSINFYGDDSYGNLYPFDEETLMAQKNINTDSLYLTNNGLDIPSPLEGLIGEVNSFCEDEIGSEATETGVVESGYIYETVELAKEAGDIVADSFARKGSGLLGDRTRNNNVETEIDPEGGILYKYKIGTAGVNPTYYDKTSFVGEIDSLLNSIGTYKNHLVEIQNQLGYINDDENTFVPYFEKSDITDNVDSYIDYLNDSVGEIETYKTYFNTSSGTEEFFNDELNSFKDFFLEDSPSFLGKIEERANSVIGTVGETISDKLKKWRFFWIKQRIGKPLGTLISSSGLESSEETFKKELENKEEALEIFFPEEYDKWVPTPALVSCYYKPIVTLIEETQEIDIIHRSSIIFNGQDHVEKYRVYRKDFEDVIFTNPSDWGEEFYIGETNELEYNDLTVEEGKEYVYRVKAIDTINKVSGNNTSSLQSSFFSLSYDYIKESDITILVSKNISGTIFLESKVNNIVGKKETTEGFELTLDGSPIISSGSFKVIPCMVSIP